ncbi:MAG: UPF0280 family protein [Desulfarculaceae bacterium]|nr:UPF0280 family protein [Desulfarculaceae bacterium]MCF8071839.1 UPF0280 family protein [Desulfarculaceae bacterium]MCF8101389.1 UPF0280 family protein [Desulfarculaceae bacterium]MCF8117380.1 UPF0280 family protein [Desulfarculaceae bacterium]
MPKFQERIYRVKCGGSGLASFTATVKETDLWITASQDLSQEAVEAVMVVRRGLESYLLENPAALTSLEPLPPDPTAPPVMQAMLAAGQAAGTGPMAAVAGAIAQEVGRRLSELAGEVMVENGGDVYLATGRDLTVGLEAGDSPISGRLGIKIAHRDMPLCLGTSSGTVGHSLSLGKADAATVKAPDGALADAAATALGNRVHSARDLEAALDWVSGVPGVSGALIVIGAKLAAWGDMELAPLGGPA